MGGLERGHVPPHKADVPECGPDADLLAVRSLSGAMAVTSGGSLSEKLEAKP